MKKIIQFEIIFTKPMFEELRAHLLADRHLEQAAFVLAAPNASPQTVRLLAHEIIYLTPQDFQQQSGVFLSVKPERSQEILQRCLDEGWSLIETHSHPFSNGTVSFSNIDIENEKLKFIYIADKLPKIYHATIVFGQTSLDAHFYDKRNNIISNVDRIKVIGSPQKLIFPVSAARMQSHFQLDTGRFGRQVSAFGATGQDTLAQTRVGIVGLGGIGSHLVQQLAYLGVEDFVLVDPDHVETTNLNRLVGATSKDTIKEVYKVEVAKRLIHQISPGTRVDIHRKNIVEPKAAKALKGVDFIFGAADNDGCRLLLNRIAVQHLIPYLDVGTGIQTSQDRLKALGGQLRLVLPGYGFCLNCTNSIDRVQAGLDLMAPEQTHLRQTFGYGLGPQTPAPAVIFLNGALASLAVGNFLNFLTGYKQLSSYLLVDLLKPSILTIQVERQTNCVTCSTKALLAKGDLEPIPTSITRKPLPQPGKTS